MMRAASIILIVTGVLFPGFSVFAAAQSGVLADQEIVVLRGDFKEVHFLVPEGEDTWEFQGDFRSSGGFRDDITFLALSQPQYVRWFSHYDHQAEARLEKKKDGKFSFRAKPGETYYFVFDNFFSSVSNKKILFHLELVKHP